jgi:plasmid maintenance system killer protein
MIKTFKCKETESIFNLSRSRKLPSTIQQVALRKLRMLNRSSTLEELRLPPANQLEKLRGDRINAIKLSSLLPPLTKGEKGGFFEKSII